MDQSLPFIQKEEQKGSHLDAKWTFDFSDILRSIKGMSEGKMLKLM